MDADILLILMQDGVVNGAIYALLALSLVLVFAVTRVILIPQGEFVAYGALTYAAISTGSVRVALLVSTAENRKSFHASCSDRMLAATRPGRISGSTTWRNAA